MPEAKILGKLNLVLGTVLCRRACPRRSERRAAGVCCLDRAARTGHTGRLMAGLIARLIRGPSDFIKLARFFDESADAWDRMEMKLPPRLFGAASRREFSAYFEGTSGVQVQCIEEIAGWLRGCESVGDERLFFERDYWQHP